MTITPWQKHVRTWETCTRCPLGFQRSRICLGRGALPCKVLFIGEAPGVSENTLGYPFAGPAGHLLDEWIEVACQTFGEDRPRIAFTNLVACFPREAKASGDNEPTPDEIKTCEPRLKEFCRIASPRLTVCVGSLAHKWVQRMRANLGLGDCKLVHITHPAAVLRATLAQKDMMSQQARIVLQTAFEELDEC